MEFFLVRRRGFPAIPAVPLPFYPRSAGRTCLAPGGEECADGVVKPFVELAWIESGGGWMLVEEQECRISAGDVVIFYPRAPRLNIAGKAGLVVRWLAFDGDNAESWMRSYGYGSLLPGVGTPPESAFKRYERALVSGTSRELRRAVTTATEVVEQAGAGVASEVADSNLVTEYIAAVERLFSAPGADVNTICAELKIHRATLSRAFRNAGRGTPGAYLREIRLEHALELLAAGCPVAEVAHRCGFWNASYFSQAVKRITGLPPGKLRSLQQ